MVRFFRFCIAIEFCMAILPAAAEGNDTVPPVSIMSSLPREVMEIYLRFHEEELCRGVDAVFVSQKNRMEIWCRVEDEGDYKKFLRMLEALSGSIRIEMFRSELSSDEGSEEEDALPPSLWENDELRALLRTPLLRPRTDEDSEMPLFMISPDEIFKQRLLIFSEQTLERSKNLERYAADLPALTRIALDPAIDPDLRDLAKKVSMEHSRNVDNQIGRLEKNLKQALPKGIDSSESGLRRRSFITIEALPDLAAQISEHARSVAGSVYEFIYPERYTVRLDELRNPGLLNSLRMLRELDKDYMDKMARTSVE